jgi:protein arginine kinase activator
MKCQHPECNEPATVHVTQIRNGKATELNLCENHAHEAGLLSGASISLPGLLAEAAGSGSTKKRRRGRKTATRCDVCGTSWSKFQSSGRLGCAHCYESFRRDLMPLLERIHESAHHEGRVPQHLQRTLGRRQDIERLQRELTDAVAREEYERAADLRDQIKALEDE